eukprot:PhF_6_TR12605/c0_g1_i3/m.19892
MELSIVSFRGFIRTRTEEEANTLATNLQNTPHNGITENPNLVVTVVSTDDDDKDDAFEALLPAEPLHILPTKTIIPGCEAYLRNPWYAGVSLCGIVGGAGIATLALFIERMSVALVWSLTVIGLAAVCIGGCLFCMCLSRSRVWKVVTSFDGLYVGANFAIFEVFHNYVHEETGVAREMMIVLGVMVYFSFTLALFGGDALRIGTRKVRLLIISFSIAVFMFYWCSHRFFPFVFNEEVESSLKTIVDIGIFKSDVAGIIGMVSLNLSLFCSKFVMKVLTGQEFTLLKTGVAIAQVEPLDPPGETNRVHAVAVKGFIRTATRADAETLHSNLATQYPHPNFHTCIHTYKVSDPNEQFEVLIPSESVQFLAIKAIFPPFEPHIRKWWFVLTFFVLFGGGIIGGSACLLFEPIPILTEVLTIITFIMMIFSGAMLTGVLSRQRFKKIVTGFDGAYLMANYCAFIGFHTYTHVLTGVSPIPLYILGTILVITSAPACFGADALRAANRYIRIFFAASSAGTFLFYWISFKFVPRLYNEDVETATADVVEFVFFKSQVGDVISILSVNIAIFCSKFVLTLLGGQEFTLLKTGLMGCVVAPCGTPPPPTVTTVMSSSNDSNTSSEGTTTGLTETHDGLKEYSDVGCRIRFMEMNPLEDNNNNVVVFQESQTEPIGMLGCPEA